MSGNSDSSEFTKHPESSSGASMQGTEIPLLQNQQVEPEIPNNVQVDDEIETNTTLAANLPNSSQTIEDKTDTGDADWWSHDGGDADSWNYHPPTNNGGDADCWSHHQPTPDDGRDAEWWSQDHPITDDGGAWEYVEPRVVAPREGAKKGLFIDSIPGMDEFLPVLSNLQKGVPELFCGCKGNREGLSRDGGITMFTTTIKSLNMTYIFDVHVLRGQVFDMVGDNGLSLRMILESEEIMKVWFDLRNDFEALSHHFNIYPRFYRDLQLLELMSCNGNRARLNGLANSLRLICRQKPDFMWTEYGNHFTWFQMKRKARDYFDDWGFQEMEERPIVNRLVLKICRGDTEIMPGMHTYLIQRLQQTTEDMRMGSSDLFLRIVDEESVIRAEAVLSGESTQKLLVKRDPDVEVMNHPRTRSPPIFRMLPAVYSWGREDELENVMG